MIGRRRYIPLLGSASILTTCFGSRSSARLLANRNLKRFDGCAGDITPNAILNSAVALLDAKRPGLIDPGPFVFEHLQIGVNEHRDLLSDLPASNS